MTRSKVLRHLDQIESYNYPRDLYMFFGTTAMPHSKLRLQP